MSKKALVIGATGLLGYGVALELNRTGWIVKAIGKESYAKANLFPPEINYICGDFYDESFLINSLKGVDTVFFFMSSTFPSTSVDSLEFEISRTVYGLDYLLRKMKESNVNSIVFPSSGGTVYGNIKDGKAKESDALKPVTPYGVGKKISEDILRYYSLQGISSLILRVGNVYGTPMNRTQSQGVIDLFIQKALKGERISIWGNALTDVRDYIFIDDFAEAVSKIVDLGIKGTEVYNLSSGEETPLSLVIETINKYMNINVAMEESDNISAAAINRVVLDNTRIRSLIKWEPKYTISAGIKETIDRKRKNMCFDKV